MEGTSHASDAAISQLIIDGMSSAILPYTFYYILNTCIVLSHCFKYLQENPPGEPLWQSSAVKPARMCLRKHPFSLLYINNGSTALATPHICQNGHTLVLLRLGK